jgi:hypothetical protein
MSRLRWDNLSVLRLSIIRSYSAYNHIGDKGCKCFTKIHTPNLKEAYLCRYNFDEDGNSIGNSGLVHLSKAQWKTIKILFLTNLVGDKIKVEGY